MLQACRVRAYGKGTTLHGLIATVLSTLYPSARKASWWQCALGVGSVGFARDLCRLGVLGLHVLPRREWDSPFETEAGIKNQRSSIVPQSRNDFLV